MDDTITALITPEGRGAVSLIRLSGKKSIQVINTLFKGALKKDLNKVASHTIHLGYIYDEEGTMVDQVLVSIFKEPNSYTGEDVVEVSHHGSPYITNKLLALLIRKGCRIARAGEFTQRAFLHAKMDLSQAEAVADLIASESKINHQIALKQLKGGVLLAIKELRDKLIHFASFLELELDFSEEDLEFANKEELKILLVEMQSKLKKLLEGFTLGNALKKGIAVSIIGKPNVGKSTLLNNLLEENKAIVSDIEGTTRDAIEDHLVIKGILFRFIDTAGIRNTSDKIEQLGIERTFESIEKSQIVLFLFDVANFKEDELLKEYTSLKNKYSDKKFFLLANKTDLTPINFKEKERVFSISAKENIGIDKLKEALVSSIFKEKELQDLKENTILIQSRHYQSIKKTLESIFEIQKGIDKKLSNDLIMVEVKEALNALGEITGEITNDTILENIFSKFCIGK